MTTENKDLGGFLSGITYGKRIKPIFAAFYGPTGAGKSTLPSKAPAPIYIDLESGTNQLEVPRLPQPETWQEFINQLIGLQNQDHPFKTIVIDTLNGAEALNHQKICLDVHINSIEDYPGGFGKGYVRALFLWREALKYLANLAKRFHVILLANSKIKRFDGPLQPTGYDRYIISIHEAAAAEIRQAVDAVLFATFKEKVREISKTVGKGIGEGERVIYTEYRPAFDAKNRFGLPYELPMEWQAFASKVKEFYIGQTAIIGGADDQEKPITEEASKKVAQGLREFREQLSGKSETAPSNEETKPEPTAA